MSASKPPRKRTTKAKRKPSDAGTSGNTKPAGATSSGAPAAGAASAAVPPDADSRLEAFLDRKSPEIFGSVVYQQQIWIPDPFDVESIHNEARDAFRALLNRAASDPPPEHGKVLLLHGEAGSGKTHLMRAFRQKTHGEIFGYFCYLQMTTEAGNYSRYLLRNFITSLEQPFLPPDSKSSLMRLSDAVLECVPGLPGDEIDAFKDGSLECDPARRAFEYADHAVKDPRLNDCDIDVMRALIHLQRGDPRIKARVIKWLRCEDLPQTDRAALGDLVPRTEPEDPIRMVEDLSRIMWALYHAPLVICVDQLEDVFNQQDSAHKFRKAVDTIIALSDRIRSSVSVVSCLEDYYKKNEHDLTRSKIDRMSRDPAPVRLASARDEDEVLDLVAKRLDHLYARHDLQPPADEWRTFPFKPASLKPLVRLRTRDVLDACQRHHEKCIAAGRWTEPDWNADAADRGRGATTQTATSFSDAIEQAWNDFRDQIADDVPVDEPGLAALLGETVAACDDELSPAGRFVVNVAGRVISTHDTADTSTDRRFLIAVCERRAQNNGLKNEVDEVEQQAGGRPLVLVRSTAFPANPKTEIARRLSNVVKKGGRHVVVENADWRAMLAFRKFRAASGAKPGFAEWQRASQPLSQLPSIRKILDLDRSLATEPVGAAKPTITTEPPSAVEPAATPKPVPSGKPAKGAKPMSGVVVVPQPAVTGGTPVVEVPSPELPFPVPPSPVFDDPPAIRRSPARAPSPAAINAALKPLLLGRSKSLSADEVRIDPAELKMHAAFLGGPGSGKTTAALSLIEQLLVQGVPAILIDRKGDLARYADPDAYTPANPFDGRHGDRLKAFRERVDVRLYTPGERAGRPLAIPIVPPDLGQMSAAEREQTAGYAAAAIGAMIGYRSRGNDQILQAILTKAVEVLSAGAAGRPVTLEALQSLVDSMDDALLNAVGGYEERHYRKLATDLLTLRLQNGRLLSTEGETLDIDALLGREGAAHEGSRKTRLSIINTQFLGSPAATEFWVAQFLMSLDRWRSRSPSDTLQAVLLLDEADIYLPALGKPSTKPPLESLLRRARSAGLGLFLSTQSPGDFDYRCRDNVRAWVVGRVRETNSLDKLKPLFADARVDIGSKLPSQQTGEFHFLREGKCTSVQTERSLVETKQVAEERIVELAALA